MANHSIKNYKGFTSFAKLYNIYNPKGDNEWRPEDQVVNFHNHRISLASIITFLYNKRREPVKVEVKKLRNILFEDVWFNEPPTVGDIGAQFITIQEADLSFPIIGNMKDIYDGNHRYLKACLLGNKTIDMIFLSKKEYLSLPKVK